MAGEDTTRMMFKDLPPNCAGDMGMRLSTEVGKNYKDLSACLGYRQADVHRFQRLDPANPGRVLLETWSQKGGTTVAVLEGYLKELDRHDILDILHTAVRDHFRLLVVIEHRTTPARNLRKRISTYGNKTVRETLESCPEIYKYAGYLEHSDGVETFEKEAKMFQGTQLTFTSSISIEEFDRRCSPASTPASSQTSLTSLNEEHHRAQISTMPLLRQQQTSTPLLQQPPTSMPLLQQPPTSTPFLRQQPTQQPTQQNTADVCLSSGGTVQEMVQRLNVQTPPVPQNLQHFPPNSSIGNSPRIAAISPSVRPKDSPDHMVQTVQKVVPQISHPSDEDSDGNISQRNSRSGSDSTSDRVHFQLSDTEEDTSVKRVSSSSGSLTDSMPHSSMSDSLSLDLRSTNTTMLQSSSSSPLLDLHSDPDYMDTSLVGVDADETVPGFHIRATSNELISGIVRSHLHRNGAYIVRPSRDDPSNRCISVINNGRVVNFRIHSQVYEHGNKYYLYDIGPFFPTINGLITYYGKTHIDTIDGTEILLRTPINEL